MSRPEQNDNWTRDASRRYDDALTPPDALGDPAHVVAHREAMALWREDGARAGAFVDPERLVRRILDAPDVEAAAPGLAAIHATRRYAAAAVLLMGVGLAGAAWLGPQPEADAPPSVRTVTQALERDRLDLVADREWDLFRAEGD